MKSWRSAATAHTASALRSSTELAVAAAERVGVDRGVPLVDDELALIACFTEEPTSIETRA